MAKQQHMINAIQDAIDVLEFCAYRNKYGDCSTHKTLIAHLESVRTELQNIKRQKIFKKS